MLSRKSEQFIVELRMYLLSKGKKEAQINEITEELKDHLLQAESHGKSVEHIVGESPKEYMKSIGETMSTDFRELSILVPFVFLVLAAYISISPAIEGNFSLSSGVLWISFFAVLLAVSVYSLILFKVVPKFFHSKWLYVLGIGSFLMVTGIGVGILLWHKNQQTDMFFVASPMQNNLIIAFCVLIFILFAIYTKTWFSIIVPAFISIGPLVIRFLPQSVNENPTYIVFTVLIIFFITAALLIYFFIRKQKKSRHI